MVLDRAAGAQVVERAAVAEPHELLAPHEAVEPLVGIPRDRDPLAVLAQSVLGGGPHGRGDVRRERPRRRRPDDKRFPFAVEQGEAHEERRIGLLLVDARLRQLVLGERGATAGTPLGRPVPDVEPAAVVDDLQEPPDVLDVRIAEGEVVVAPVHPLAESLRAADQVGGGADDDVAAAPRELLEPELLDLALGVEPELALDADLDPEPLAVEAVLVALVEALQGLVALEGVLERAAPCRVDGEGLVRRHRAVEERPPAAAAVTIAELLERPLPLPPLEHGELEGIGIGKRGQWVEHKSSLGAEQTGSVAR
jgi:hypothetical protein